MNLDKQVWGDDAEDFRPERFLGSGGRMMEDKIQTFGGGTRHCM
jgi:cytochrome P450